MSLTAERDVVLPVKRGRVLTILLWIALSTGLAVSTFTLIEEMCLATACSDAAVFTFFGVGLGWLGIAYFCFMLLLLWFRQKSCLLNWALSAMIFSGIGAELRLLWIQKTIIGSWCPLCVTICCALFAAAIIRVVEMVQEVRTEAGNGKKSIGWLALVPVMAGIGFFVAYLGVKALT